MLLNLHKRVIHIMLNSCCNVTITSEHKFYMSSCVKVVHVVHNLHDCMYKLYMLYTLHVSAAHTCTCMLCTCTLHTSLTALISESPLTLQLNFEPSGRPGKDREYYLMEKQNICVVCGRDTDCVRKCIIPHEYRKLVK